MRQNPVVTPPAPPTPPLGPDDFDAQDAELDALRERREEIPQWEFCEGFLAALVCTRRVVAPEEYWPVLLGDEFNPVHHMEFVWRWRRRWVEVAAALDEPVETLEDERTYRPEVLDTRGAVLALPEAERMSTSNRFRPTGRCGRWVSCMPSRPGPKTGRRPRTRMPRACWTTRSVPSLP